MNILVIGNNEIATSLTQKIATSYHCNKLYTTHSNVAISSIAEKVDIIENDFDILKQFCVLYLIDVVVFMNNDNTIVDTNVYKQDDYFRNIILVNAYLLLNNEVDNKVYKVVAITNKTNLQIIGMIKENIISNEEELLRRIENEISLQPFANKHVEENRLGCFDVIIDNNSTTIKPSNHITIQQFNTILQHLETDIVALFAAADNGTLEDVNINYC